MPAKTTSAEFCKGVTAAIASKYGRRHRELYAKHPEERLTASCIVYSRLRREVWMIGDCQCLIGENYFDNPKPSEAIMAEKRAKEARRLIDKGLETTESLLEHDIAREAILPQLIEEMKNQNVTYSVIDGFPIPRQKVRVIPLDFSKWTIVLASDGYPFLHPSLEESERALAEQRKRDPLNIDTFKATKAFKKDFNSFDDRAYIRFKVRVESRLYPLPNTSHLKVETCTLYGIGTYFSVGHCHMSRMNSICLQCLNTFKRTV